MTRQESQMTFLACTSSVNYKPELKIETFSFLDSSPRDNGFAELQKGVEFPAMVHITIKNIFHLAKSAFVFNQIKIPKNIILRRKILDQTNVMQYFVKCTHSHGSLNSEM